MVSALEVNDRSYPRLLILGRELFLRRSWAYVRWRSATAWRATSRSIAVAFDSATAGRKSMFAACAGRFTAAHYSMTWFARSNSGCGGW